MKLRPPSVPLFTFDPYFSVWSPADRLTDRDTVHWTGSGNLMLGIATIDGKDYRFMGRGGEPAMEQLSLDIAAMSSAYVFSAGGVELAATFTSPLLLDPLERMSRPIGYLDLSARPLDGRAHAVSVTVALSGQFCMDRAGDSSVRTGTCAVGPLSAVWMESADQKPLGRDGDDLRIEWGRLWLAGEGATASVFRREAVETPQDSRAANDHVAPRDLPEGATAIVGLDFIALRADLDPSARLLVGYDDFGQSLLVSGKPCAALWTSRWKSMEEALRAAAEDADETLESCRAFSDALELEATRAGGVKYAELLLLAYRQAIAAHKLVADENGELLFVSKECFSNGCAATVDVSYPSTPLFLRYAPELVSAMLRPIYRFARSKDWPFDFAPHDAGRYPFVDVQRYGVDEKTGQPRLDSQMPVEGCGNMIVMEALAAFFSGDPSNAAKHLPTLEKWAGYLLEHGGDPGNQLCTDDFAGHLAHNCNLAIKAIVGIASLGLIHKMLDQPQKAGPLLAKAVEMAGDWLAAAANGDGTTRLAFDRPGTTSLKYNAVWDKILGLGLFPASFFEGEIRGALRRQLPYGAPLDSRAAYTKADWLVWTAALAEDPRDFEALVSRLWEFYHRTPMRVPMTDWYWADTAMPAGFQARSVVGGLFIRLLRR
ncbi:MAG: glutaminase domain-containing protein [Kiritimatiellia bacterium]|jgi:hypothetical protein